MVWVMAPCNMVGSTDVSEERAASENLTAYLIRQEIRGDAAAAVCIRSFWSAELWKYL